MSATEAHPRVAFGLRIVGVDGDALVDADRPEWPELHVRRRRRSATGDLHDSGSRLALGDGDWLEVDRGARTATYVTRDEIDEATLIHPWLAPAAGLVARSLGREVLHAGAFLAAGGAWAVTGSNEAGKSTILATLALAGTSILTDDLLVVDERVAYAGPRCIDLRRLHGMGAGEGHENVRRVRAGTRDRLRLPDVDPAVALRGWLFLEWGARVEAVPCNGAQRLRRLAPQRRWATNEADPMLMLELASLPAWTLRRPRGWQHMDACIACIDEITAGAPARREAA